MTKDPDQVDSWPVFKGDYVVGDPRARVAVVTLASHLLVRNSAIHGTCKTENLGIEKIIANIISNSNIRFLLICGSESRGHLPGNTLISLHENGIDEQGRIIGSKGAIPFIQNLPPGAVGRFRDQVSLIDRIGLEDEALIEQLVDEYSNKAEPYPDGPFISARQRKRSGSEAGWAGQGDVLFGSHLNLDSSAWIIMEG